LPFDDKWWRAETPEIYAEYAGEAETLCHEGANGAVLCER
jgi:hypothetical protein